MSDDSIERFVAELRQEADATHVAHLTDPAVAAGTRHSPWLRLRTRTAALAASILAIGGLSGVAYAANGSAPGDLLYGVDKALEAIGIGNGHAAERFAEVQSLVDEGQVGRGLQHAADTVVDDLVAQTALLEAAARIAGSGAPGDPAPTDAPPVGVPPSDPPVEAPPAGVLPDGVSDLLTYLGSEPDGGVDGETVADYAQKILPPAGAPEVPPVGTPPVSVPPSDPPADMPPVNAPPVDAPPVDAPPAPVPAGAPPVSVPPVPAPPVSTP